MKFFRIVGGQPVPLGRSPYFAFIWATSAAGNVQCGGSLIANNWVLTVSIIKLIIKKRNVLRDLFLRAKTNPQGF